MNGEEYVISKKKNLIDEAPISKKAARNQQKNLNKTMATVRMMQELDLKQMQKKQSQKTNSSASNSNSNTKMDPKTKKKVEDIKAILPQLPQPLILSTLQKHNFNQQQTLQQLFNIQPESLDPPQPPSSSLSSHKKPQSKEQLANQLLNQIYQNNDQIDPSQFQQLFAQIADIIKEEQKIQGMDLFQINSFIDDCYLIKNVILQDQNQIYIDENDQLCRQTELFMEEIIKNRVALEIKRQQQFPTLGSVTKNNPSQKGTIQKIQQQYEQQRRNQDYFTPSTVPRIYHHNSKQQTNKNSVFMVNNNPRSYEDILQLSKEYNDMGIDKLKWIYLRLQDINLCKRFLDKFYADKKRVIKVEKVQKKDNNNSQTYTSSNKPVLKHAYKRLEDANFKSYTLAQIRDELDHLFKLRSVFRMTKGKTTNIGYRKQLDRLAHRDDSRIDKLIQVARYKSIENMIDSDLQYIDLHGYREQQIDQLFEDIADMIRTQFKKGNSKLQTCKVGTNVCCAVRALTGKGLHSKYNRSVLKPALMSWCDRKGYKTTQTEDSINIFIEVR